MSTAGIIIDIIVVAALIICGLIGLKKGFIKSILSLFSWAVCIFVAVFFARYVARWLNNIYNFDALIGNKIANSLIKYNNYFSTPANQFASTPMPDLGFWGTITKNVFKKAANYGDATIGAVVGKSLGRVCMIVIAGVLVFVVIKILLLLLNKLFNKITNIKILGWLNKLLGAIFGVLKAAVIIIIFNIVLAFLSLLPPVNKTVTPVITEHTVVEKFVYNTTDRVIKDKVIDGGMMQDWLSDLWEKK